MQMILMIVSHSGRAEPMPPGMESHKKAAEETPEIYKSVV